MHRRPIESPADAEVHMRRARASFCRTSFRSKRWGIAALAFGFAVGILAGITAEAHAADCAGGTARRIGLRRDGARYVGTFTYPGATHSSFVRDPAGFALTIVDAADDARVLLEVHAPASSFHSTQTQTSYDGSGPFRGRIRL